MIKMTEAEKDQLIVKLGDALETLSEHFGYCGGGDAWERECWEASGSEAQVEEATKAYDNYKELINGTVKA